MVIYCSSAVYACASLDMELDTLRLISSSVASYSQPSAFNLQSSSCCQYHNYIIVMHKLLIQYLPLPWVLYKFVNVVGILVSFSIFRVQECFLLPLGLSVRLSKTSLKVMHVLGTRLVLLCMIVPTSHCIFALSMTQCR